MQGERPPCEGEGKGQRDAFISQEMPKVASKLPEAGGEAWSIFFLADLRSK